VALQFPVSDLRTNSAFGPASVLEVAPFGPDPAGGPAASDRLVLQFQGLTADLVAPFDAFVQLVAAPADVPGSPSVVELQPLVTGPSSVALSDGLDGLHGALPPAIERPGLLPRVRLHDVDPGVIEAALTPVIESQVTATNATDETARVARFRAGDFGVVVESGAVIASAIGGVAIQLLSSDGVAIDPVAYYSHYLAVPAAPGDPLADRDWCAALFSHLTRRALVQVVDSHGRPWNQPVRVTAGTGGTTNIDVSAVNGTLAVARFPPAAPTEVLVTSIELPEPGPEAGGQVADRYLLTSTWPAGTAAPLGPIALDVATRPTMRRFVVSDLRRWLASQHVTDPTHGLPRYTLENHVIALPDGLNDYRLILQDFRDAIKIDDGFYYLTAWSVDPNVPLDGKTPEAALSSLIGELAGRPNGHVRVMVWDTFHTESTVLQTTVQAAYGLAVLLLAGSTIVIPPAALVASIILLAGQAVWATGSVNPIIEKVVAKALGDNADAVDKLEQAGAEVIFDGKVRETRTDGAPRLYDFVGSHHQKLSVIRGPSGVVAYCGGIDMRNNRLEDQRHLGASPYHDLHCRVAGPAAFDFATTFRQRWDDQAAATGHTVSSGDGGAASAGPDKSSHVVQVARTYPNGIDLFGNGYQFAPLGDRTIRATIRNAIGEARRFIYVEDQYLTPPDDLADLIAQRMRDVPELKLVMVIPRGSDQPENTSRRATFIGNLLEEFKPERVIALFPTRIAFPHDRERHGPVATRLRGPIADSDTELEVDDATGFPDSGTVLVDTEEIAYTSRDLTTNKLVLGATGRRGHNNTPADAHADRTRVAQVTYRDIFVHAKLWIIDDVFVSLGSANVNNRGMNHDSEANVFVVDGQTDRSGRRFAKQLRVDLWAEHLGIGESRAARMLLDDPDRALALLVERPGPAGNRLRRYWHQWNAEHKTESWGSLLAPGLYWDAYQTIEGQLVDDGVWATYIDPDGSAPLA
jgi:phosphatidylserine/phosphatidylglycerophosphate/cardiolipin synthase-like enzyme